MRTKDGIVALILIVIAFSAVLQIQPFRVAAVQTPPNGTFFDNIVFIIMENEGLSDICGGNPPPCSGANAPYMSSLANSNTIADNYTGLSHNSVENYVALLGGNTTGIKYAKNLVDLLESAGLTWKGYMESQPDTSGCDVNNSYPYNNQHNPFIQFQDITNNTARCAKIARADPSGCVKTDCQLINDLNSPSPANFMWLTPNDCNNMHSSTVCTNGCTTAGSTTCIVDGNNYLQNLVPNILNSTTFENTRAALFIAFDEGNGYCPSNQSTKQDCVYTVFAGPQSKKGFVAVATHSYNHYSFLKTVESNWGLTCLINDCSASVMSEFFVAGRTIGQPSLVTSPNVNIQPSGYPWDGNGFYAQGRSWVFYLNYGSCGTYNITNCLNYATSTNAISWSTYNIGVVTGATPSIVTNGTHVFYARYEGVDSESGEDIMFRVGALHNDGTIAWQPEVVARAGVSGAFFYSLSMRISTTGQAFIAYQNASSSWGAGYPFVIHSNGADYSAWQQNTQLSASSDQWRFSLAALSNGQVYILYWPFWGMLRGRLWSSGTWSSEEIVTPSNTYVQNVAFSFSTGTSTVYAIWQDRASQKIQFASRSGSWGSPQTIATSDTGNNPRWTASYDSLQGRWYIMYYNYTSNQIYQYSGAPGSWSLRTQLWTTQGSNSTMAIGSFYNSAQVNSSTSILGAFWMQSNNPTANEQLMFADETITLF